MALISDGSTEGTIIEPNNWRISSTGIQPLYYEEPYTHAIVVKEMGEETVQYAIYKGTGTECADEHKRLIRLRYEERQLYRQNGNGTPQRDCPRRRFVESQVSSRKHQ